QSDAGLASQTSRDDSVPAGASLSRGFGRRFGIAAAEQIVMSTWDLSEFTSKDVVFIGKGRGRAMAGVEEFLQKHCNINSLTGVDKQPGDDPWAFLAEYDQDRTVFIKNEAVPGREIPVPYLTQLQLFFRLVKQRGAKTIGITGTKGKST